MLYHYIASQPNGKITEGDMEAEAVTNVLEFLATRNLRPISIKPIKGMREVGKRSIFTGTLTLSDQVFLTKYLALMLKVGMDLFTAIDILIADFEKPVLKALLLEVRSNLEKGKPFYTTFEKYPKYFSAVFVNLIKAGEASGSLEGVLRDLSTSLEKEKDLRGRIKAALIYPIILLVGSVGVLVIMVTFAIPRIATLFTSSGITPPTFSRVVFAVGLFTAKYIWLLLPGLILLVGGLYFLARKTLLGRKIIYRVGYIVPVVRVILEKLSLQRFAGTLASLMRAGLPIIESLEITANTLGSAEMREALIRISREGVSKGLTIGDAFRKEAAFPKTVTNLIAISEKAGHLEEVLQTLSTFYESEIDTSIKALVSFLEPMLLVGIAVVIGGIALSIILPIYQLVGQF